MYYLGFDIGGSSVKAVVLKNRKVVFSKVFEDLPNNFTGLLKLLKNTKNNLANELGPKSIGGIGISIPGPLDKKRQRVVIGPNIHYLTNKPVLKLFKRELAPYPVEVEHDVHCHLLAEKVLSLGKKYGNVLCLTLGTGIGGAFMVNGEIIFGSHGSAGEIGHMITSQEKVPWENLAAKKFIKKELGIGALLAQKRAIKGDKKARKAFEAMGYNLGIGLANIINILDPEVIIIGGGLITARKFFSSSMKKAIRKLVISREAQKTKILFSKLGRFGGALGAALLFTRYAK